MNPKNTSPNKQREAVWREIHPNSKILFINVCFHLNEVDRKWFMVTVEVFLKKKKEYDIAMNALHWCEF